MIRHIVLVRFRADLTDAEIAVLFGELRQIEGKVSGIRSICSGRSAGPEQMERGFRHGFVVDFDDWEALQAYQDNAGHQSFGTRLIAHAEGGKDGILVFDLPIADGRP